MIMNDVIETGTVSDTSEKEWKSFTKSSDEKKEKRSYKPVARVLEVYEIKTDPLKYEITSEELQNRTLRPVHEIAGEPFHMAYTERKVILNHERWSLTGSGKTLLEAEKKIIAEAKQLAQVFLDIPLTSLDTNAKELREFLLKL